MNLTGQPAIEFDLLDTYGNHHTLEMGKGNWQLLVFHRHLG
jgi:peroxiredoxin